VTDEQNNGTTSVNPAFAEVWDQGVCKPPSVAIRSLHNVINRYLAVTHPEQVEGLSGGNIDIITFLARHSEREIFPQDVERRFGVTRSTSSRVLALMERKGLVERESVPHDRRLKKIVLTDKSQEIAEALRENAIAMEGVLLQGLSDDEICQFMHTLDVMQSNLVSTGMVGDCKRYPSLAMCTKGEGLQAQEEMEGSHGVKS
jgi:DNA-binding MarR family transcriptional regulator